MRTQALEDRIAADLALGRHRDVIPELEGLVQGEPLNERYGHQLMLALSTGRAGRPPPWTFTSTRRTAFAISWASTPVRRCRSCRSRFCDRIPELTTPAAVGRARATDLPTSLTRFVGREDDIHRAAEQLTRARLVMLTGVGGAGKSRLAFEVTGALSEAFPDGIWAVELATVSDPALIDTTLATAVGVRERPRQPREAVLEKLRPATALLVIDNCEHLLGGITNLHHDVLRVLPKT